MATRRIAAFDIAKGVAMLAVIVGHSDPIGVSEGVRDFCFSFHMPLFFIVAGYFCHPDVRPDVAYARKNLRALVAPYAITCCLIIALTCLKYLLFDPGAVGPSAWSLLVASLYGAGAQVQGMPAGIGNIGAIWFLLALFWARIFLAGANATPCPLAMVAGLFVAGVWVDAFWAPWSIQAGMCATAFLYIGQKVRQLDLFAPGRIPALMWATMLGVWLYCGVFYGKMYLVGSDFGQGPMDLVGSVCGTMCIVKGAMLLEARAPALVRPLDRIGVMTLPLLCAHIVEILVFPWPTAIRVLSSLPVPMWIPGLALRCALIAALTLLLWALPRPVSGLFFPARRKAVAAPASAK